MKETKKAMIKPMRLRPVNVMTEIVERRSMKTLEG
jgi:hypothetical protein